jgi:hypothetical protein
MSGLAARYVRPESLESG